MRPQKLFLLLCLLLALYSNAQPGKNFCITAYYAGSAERLDSFPIDKITHLIFSFGHLKENRLNIGSAADSNCIRKMVSYKEKYPGLRIILSLGGWTGCFTCSPVFSTANARKEFAASVKLLTDYFHTDGIDLDWEYPAIPGPPGHPYAAADKHNFTLLLQSLREALGKDKEISFAAGGFDQFIDSSIEWKEAMRYTDKVYVMSYDLVHGYSKTSGHHTPLYSTPGQKASTDNAVNRMIAAGVPPKKIVIGAAFYARMFQVADTMNKGLYRPCSFYRGVSWSHLSDSINAEKGFTQYWDKIATAPYAFNPERKILVTYDNERSVSSKTKYVLSRKLGGIMFWQLADDKLRDGLLDAIWEAGK